jgi:hypothetical protein
MNSTSIDSYRSRSDESIRGRGSWCRVLVAAEARARALKAKSCGTNDFIFYEKPIIFIVL